MCILCASDPLHSAINAGDLGKVFDLVKNENLVNKRSPCGKTPLMSACYVCHKEIILLLLSSGSVVNALDDVTGDTAAHYVTHSLCGVTKQCACMMVLGENQVDVSIRNNDGYTVLELAEKNGNTDVAHTFETLEH